MKKQYVFKGQWITTREASGLEPVNVFHRQLQPIAIPAKLTENLHVLYRKKFTVFKCEKTTIYITADDYYKLYVNGEFVTQGPAPGFPFHYYYNVIDITPFVKSGENVIAVHTYYQGLINRVWVSGDDRHGLIFDVVQEQEVIAKSDTTVKQTVHTGYSELGQAGYKTQFLECYDCRSNCIGFEQPDYDDSSWENAFVHQHAQYELFEQPTKQLEMEEIEPICVKKDEKGYFIDFGSIYVGGLYAEAQGQWNDKIIIRCGQELTEEGEVRFDIRANCRYEEMWILSGKEDSLHQYDYKSFRYCRLCVPAGVHVENIKMIIRHYPFTQRCECSYPDEDLRRIWELCVNSLKYGVQDVIQDCMDREKGQYMGDGSLSAAALAVVTGDTSIMEKLIDDALRTDFINEGFVTCSPCSFMQEMAEYPLMLPQLFMVHWQLKKDKAFLEERYGKLVAMLDFYTKNYGTPNGMLDRLDKWFVLDWPKECRDDYDFVWNEGEVMVGIHNVINAYYIGAIKIVNKIAAILNKEPYMNTDDLEDTYIQLFYDKNRKLFKDTPESEHISLPSNAFALMYDLCPNKETEENIVKLILETDASKTAFFTTFAALCGLWRIGKKEEMQDVLRNPGRWLRMLREGATVTFEAWGKDLKWNTSLFHLCYTYAILFLTEWETPRNSFDTGGSL